METANGNGAPQPLALKAAVLDRIRPYYAGQRILVTGGLSFIGSHLVEALVSAGADVVVADNASSGRLENVQSVAPLINVLIGDLRNPEFADQAVAGVDSVFHLAAAHGGRGYIDTHPVECLNNMVLDHHVFAAAATARVRKVIYASTACVYPTKLQASEEEQLLLVEEDAGFDFPEQAASPDGEYGWYKLTGELQLRAFAQTRGWDAVACRIFTAYGERENESHAAIALIAKAVARLDPYPIWGSGNQTRNFTYVGDTVAGLCLAGCLLTGYETINVGSSKHVTISELIDEIFTQLDWRPSEIARELDRPVGVLSRAADVTKCEKLLGWSPAFSLSEGVDRTLRWYESTVTPERLSRLDSLLMTR